MRGLENVAADPPKSFLVCFLHASLLNSFFLLLPVSRSFGKEANTLSSSFKPKSKPRKHLRLTAWTGGWVFWGRKWTTIRLKNGRAIKAKILAERKLAVIEKLVFCLVND
jgi:hypothetical protein